MQVFHKAWVQGMTIANVTSCFLAAGVYPVDISAAMSQLDTSNSPSCNTGMPYMCPSVPLAKALHNPHQHLLIQLRLFCFPLVRWKASRNNSGKIKSHGMYFGWKRSTPQTISLAPHHGSVSYYLAMSSTTCAEEGTHSATRRPCPFLRAVHQTAGGEGDEKEGEAGRKGKEKGRV